MKRIIIILLVGVFFVGCTAPWRVNPATGEIPLVSAASEAIGPALSGNWIGAAIALVGGIVTGCMATKKKKDNQLGEVVAAVENFKGEAKGGEAELLLGLLSKSMNSGTKELVKKLIGKIPKDS